MDSKNIEHVRAKTENQECKKKETSQKWCVREENGESGGSLSFSS
jgi:hypothetical protein